MRPILFDLDGTLLDSLDGIVDSAQATLAHYGRAALPRASILAHVGAGAPHLIGGILHESKGSGGELSIDPHEALVVYRAHYEANAERSAKLFAGVTELLASLTDRPMAVVSNKGERSVKAMLEATGIGSSFQVIAGYETFGEAKPSAVPLLAALDLMQADPAHAWMVGDGEQDLLAARNAGIRSIAVTWGITSRAILESFSPTRIVESMAALRDALDKDLP